MGQQVGSECNVVLEANDFTFIIFRNDLINSREKQIPLVCYYRINFMAGWAFS